MGEHKRNKNLNIFKTLSQKDKEGHKQSLLEILEMVRARLEAGDVDSLCIIMIGKDPLVSGGEGYTGSRFLLKPQHMDLVDDVYTQTMRQLEEQYHVTVEGLRKDRAREGK
jgi:hypothetical protein